MMMSGTKIKVVSIARKLRVCNGEYLGGGAHTYTKLRIGTHCEHDSDWKNWPGKQKNTASIPEQKCANVNNALGDASVECVLIG